LAISVTASAQNVAPVVTTPIAPFTVFAGAPARSIDLTTAFSDPDRRMRCSRACRFPQARASSLLRSTGSTNQSRLAISELRKFRAVFPDRRDVVQGGGFIGTVDSAEPAVLVTLQMGNYTAIVRGVGAMPTGLALLEIYPQ